MSWLLSQWKRVALSEMSSAGLYTAQNNQFDILANSCLVILLFHSISFNSGGLHSVVIHELAAGPLMN